MTTSIYGLPLWLIITLGVLGISFIVYLIIRALREGREISFWPPRIGPKLISEQPEPNKHKSERKKDDIKPPQVLLPASPIGMIVVTAGPRQGLWVFLTEQTREVIAGRSDPVSNFVADIDTDDYTMGRKHFKISITPITGSVKGNRNYKIQLTDLDSVNGTFLNGKLVKATVDLHHGDLIQAGGSKFEVKFE